MDELREKIDDPLFYDRIGSVYTDGDYHLLGIADQGMRVMSTNRKVDTLDDFKGQKIRTMENSNHLAFWKALGASPTPMSFSEVYIGLQQHTIDAQENPYEVIVSNRLYEQQDYVVETNHLPHLITLIVNDAFYNDLSQEARQIMDEAAANATAYAREMADERIEEKKNRSERAVRRSLSLTRIHETRSVRRRSLCMIRSKSRSSRPCSRRIHNKNDIFLPFTEKSWSQERSSAF